MNHILQNRFSSLTGILVGLLLAALTCGPAGAKEFTPFFGVGVETHTNINRGNNEPRTGNKPPPGEKSDTVFRPYAGFNFSEKVDKVSSEIQFRVERQLYSKGSFDDQNFFAVDGFVDYEVVPGRFIWATEDSANTRRIIIQDPDTPDNLQTFNVFTTGPDLYFNRGANDIVVKGRLGDVHYSDQLADNTRFIGSVAWKREVSEVSKVGLNVSGSLVRFQQEFQVDYDLAAVVAGYDRETPWGSLGVQGGYNFFDFENGVSENEPVIQGALVVGGKEGSANALTFSASQKFSDPALDVFDPIYTRLFQVQGVGTVDTNERAGTGASRTRRGELSFERRGDRYGLKLFGYYQNLDRPVDIQESQKEKGGGLNLNYVLRERLNVWVSYFRFESDFVNRRTGDEDAAKGDADTGEPINVNGETVAVGLTWQVRDRISLSAGAKWETNDSNSVERRFEDNTVFVSLQYQGETPK